MASFVTETNDRGWQLRATLKSLAETVDWGRHRLFVIDNGSTQEAHDIYSDCKTLLPFTLISLPKNVGTARAINRAWAQRQPGEHAVKLDSDMVFHESGWLDRMTECVEREPTIGIIGVKRVDLMENPWRDASDWYKSELVMLKHELGQRWLVVEKANHIIGSATLFNEKLLDRIGGLTQPGEYGLDDSLAAARCTAAGFWNCFWPHTLVSHIDPGGTDYSKWKGEHAGQFFPLYHRMLAEYANGTRSLYVDPAVEQ